MSLLRYFRDYLISESIFCVGLLVAGRAIYAIMDVIYYVTDKFVTPPDYSEESFDESPEECPSEEQEDKK